jgi:hypothetical protein
MPINTNAGAAPSVARPVFEDGETYFARVVQVVDLGLQPGGEYQGQPKPDKEQVLITFEFGDVLNGEGKPGWLSVNLDLPDRWETGAFKGMHVKSNLYKYLGILYPDGIYKGKNPNYANFSRDFKFWDGLLGKTAQLTVKVYDPEQGRAAIVKGSIAKVPAKFANSVPALQNDPASINFDTITKEQWDNLYPWIQTKIKGSLDPAVRELAAKLDGEQVATKPTPKKQSKPKVAEVMDADFDDDLPF